MQPDNPDYLESLAQYLAQAPGIVGGDRDSAARLATRLRGVDEVRGTFLMADVLRRGNGRDKARGDSVVDALGRAHPGDVRVLTRIATYWAQNDQPERALTVNEQLLARDPGNVVARFGVGRNLVVLKRDPQRAAALLRESVNAPAPRPNQPGVVAGAPWWRLGQAYVQLGQPDSARLAFERALQANPQLTQARRSLDSLTRR